MHDEKSKNHATWALEELGTSHFKREDSRKKMFKPFLYLKDRIEERLDVFKIKYH